MSRISILELLLKKTKALTGCLKQRIGIHIAFHKNLFDCLARVIKNDLATVPKRETRSIRTSREEKLNNFHQIFNVIYSPRNRF